MPRPQNTRPTGAVLELRLGPGLAHSNVLTYEAQVPQATSWAWQVLSSEYLVKQGM